MTANESSSTGSKPTIRNAAEWRGTWQGEAAAIECLHLCRVGIPVIPPVALSLRRATSFFEGDLLNKPICTAAPGVVMLSQYQNAEWPQAWHESCERRARRQ